MPILFANFHTAIGRCAIAWSASGLVGVQLPEANEGNTRSRVLERFPDAREAVPPPEVASASDALAGLLRGEQCDLSSVLLDMKSLPPFHRRVYDTARRIPFGVTATYGAVARVADAAGAARAVGQALARNPFPLIVPCHRVVAVGGKTGGFSAHGGATMKLRLLAIEGQANAAQAIAAQDNPTPGLFEGPCAIVRI
jgi:methylated-DNA-[protein]-cysteine S-methyltransferase